MTIEKAFVIGTTAVLCCAPLKLSATVHSLGLSFAENAIIAADSSNTLDDTSELWLVWDSTDRGNALASWPAANRVQFTGTIPSEDSKYQFDRTLVPAGSVFRVIATSRARWLGEDGYVYAGTSQYIDTGIKANAIYGLYIKFMYSANDYNGYNAYGLLISDEGNKDFAIGRYPYGGQPDGYFYFKHRNTTGTPNGFIDFSGGVGAIHEIAVTNQMATLDGAVAVSDLEEGTIGQKALRVWLNNGYSDNSTSEGALSGKCCHARWYAVRFNDEDGDAILNLVPAVWNGEGVLYDTVSGKCHANANAATGGLTWSGTPGEVIDGTEATSAASDAIANEMSITVAKGGIDVSVPAGTLSSVSELWLVWDSADRGAVLADWPVANRRKYSGATSSAAATYRFAKRGLPFKCVFRVIANEPTRLLGDGGYVYAGTSQYIDTGIKANAIYGLYIKFMYSARDYNGPNAYGLLISDEGNKDFAIGRYAASGKPDGYFYFKHRNTTGTPNGYIDISGGVGAIHEIAVTNQMATLDGNVAVSGLSEGTIGQKNLRVWLNNGYTDNSTSEGALSGKCCHARWYSVRFDDASGNAILNLVPAVYGDSEGVLYDLVSGKMLRNAGTGTMTYGGTPGDTVAWTVTAAVPVSMKRKGMIVFVK